MSRPRRQSEITPDLLIRAYSIGLFPMAEDREAEHLFWVEPDERGIFPLDALKVSRSLAKSVRSDRFEVRADGDFEAVMRACAERDKTWINAQILKLYCELHRAGRAHSVEVHEEGALVGGLYGVSLGAAFFGESMFHRATDASKVALVHLAARLKLGGYRLLDAQFLTPHLATLGAIEISRAEYRRRLEPALAAKADFSVYPVAKPMSGALALSLALGLRGHEGAGAA
jgi:leucyl/phenylalanyl-tRNA---protein transferase